MAIQYYMRAFNTTLVQYVDWVVNDAPDSTGAFSGYPSNQLIDITVNRVVQSKIENFLKPNQGLGGQDGYYLHVNAYDTKNITPPINVPSNLVGLAVERGVTSVATVNSATNVAPIVITTAAPHGLTNGQYVTISGVLGNLAANGTFQITFIGASTFSLNNSRGSGAYTSGGTVYTPTNFSTLTWDESNSLWRFVVNTNGDAVTLGAHQAVRLNNLFNDGYISNASYIALGLNPASQGLIRMQNNQYAFWRNTANSGDVQGIGVDTLNRIKLGASAGADWVYMPGQGMIIDGYIAHAVAGITTNGAQSGFIREQNNTIIAAFRNQGLSADIAALSSNATNNVILGDNVNSGVLYRTTTGNVHQFQVNNIADFEIGNTFARFTTTVVAPLIFQTDNTTNSSVGQTLTFQAQNATGTTSTGGTAQVTSGTGTPNDGNAGNVNLNTGGVTKLVISPTVTTSSNADVVFAASGTRTGLATTTIAAGSNGATLPQATINVASTLGTVALPAFPSFGVINVVTSTGLQAVYYTGTTGTSFTGCTGGTGTMATTNAVTSAPFITQTSVVVASQKAQTFTVQAQDNTGATSTGGDLALSSGTGTSNAGFVNVQTGGVNQIIVSPTNLPALSFPTTTGKVIITGNLEVQGTTTTVDSTVVDIIGRVIHANWADPTVSPNVAVPNQITGYSIHRGNAAGIPRDGASWIWTEGALNSGADGYWRAVTIPGDGYAVDGYTIANVLNPLSVMAADFSASPDPNAVSGTLPGVGGLRAINNAPAVVARNVSPSTTLTATGLTNGSATLPLATITVVSTTGFTTPSGSLLIQSSTGQQVVTYTGTTGTSFTGAAGGAGTIITGGIVAQTNNSTTIAAGSNNVTLPTGTINVATTVGFPATGTIRVVTTGGVQTVAYTGLSGGTQFTGCTGGVGTMFTGGSVSSLPITGTADLILLGTDFGNRILHGAPTVNTGHIFNTTTGSIYDFQVNSVSQIQISAADPDGDGFIEVLTVAPTVANPRIYQLVQPNTGTNNGFNMMLQAQNGQQQTGVTANNNGGLIILASGVAGTGGSGAVGIDGYVDIRTGVTPKVRVFPTAALSAADNNSILFFENLFRVDTAQLAPRIRQDDKTTNSGTGETFTIQAQNETGTTSNGGPLLLQAGTGTSTDGYINLITGTTVKVTVYPTTAISAANNNSILMFENKLRFDTAQTTPLIRQDDKTANGGTGETFTVQAQNETGTTSTGGNLNLSSGTGTSTNGTINILIGGTQAIGFNNVDSDGSGFSEVITIASTIVAPRIFQASTGAASGTILALMAQNAATTGGPLQLHSGTGASNDGYINLTTGTTVKMTIFPTTAVTAANNNSILMFENKLRFDTAQLTPLIRQDDNTTNSATGQSLTIQAQNATGTTSNGGDGYFTSGTGTNIAGNIHLLTGGVDKIIVHPAFTEFRDTAEAVRVTPVSAGTTQILFASTVTAVSIKQTDLTTNSGTGAATTIQAQNETGTTSTGGDLNLTSGSGTSLDGYLNLQAGGVTIAKVHTNKFSYLKGRRRHVTSITSAANYNVLLTDDYIAITTLSAAFQINLPTTVVIGDTYEIKDTTGNANTFNITVSGNGNNIDGAGTFVFTQSYSSAAFTYTGTQWSLT